MVRLLSFSMILFSSLVAFGDDAVNLLKPINKEDSWKLEQHGGAEATLKVKDDTVAIDATKLGSANWHVQVYQQDLDLKEGKEYTLKMKLSSTKFRSLQVAASINQADWHDIGLREDVNIDMKDRTFEFTFRATNVVEKKNRIGFILGDEKGDVIVKEMTLTEKVKK